MVQLYGTIVTIYFRADLLGLHLIAQKGFIRRERLQYLCSHLLCSPEEIYNTVEILHL